MSRVLFGVGLLIAPALSAAIAGWWSLAGIALGAGVSMLISRIQSDIVGQGSTVDDVAQKRLRQCCQAFTAVVGVSLAGKVFADYLAPTQANLAAAVFVLVIVLLNGVGFALPQRVIGYLAGIAVVAVGVLVMVSVVISPVPDVLGDTSPGWVGIPLVGAIFLALFHAGKDRSLWRLAGQTVLALAVCATALYQLGPVRLALSSTPLREVITAADARALEPWLWGVVVLLTVPAASMAFASGRGKLESFFGGGNAARRHGIRSAWPSFLAPGVAAMLAAAVGDAHLLLVVFVVGGIVDLGLAAWMWRDRRLTQHQGKHE